MATKKKPLREILPPPFPPTHFTPEEARRAVLEVMEEDRLAEEAAARAAARDRRKGGRDRSAA
ncbi:MAG TPA: hypothetical protein VF746_07070 [Longimicrobium sp.]|jgi:hypothetical protein